MDFTSILLPELVSKILTYLTAKDLCRFAECCIDWRELANSDSVWLQHCMAKGWLRFGLDGDILKDNHLKIYVTNIAGNSPVFSLKVPENSRLSPICKWKNVFIRVQHLNKNWVKGRYNVCPVLKGHKEKVTALACNGRFIATGSEDMSLLLWDISQKSCVKKLDGHMDTITTIIWKGNTLITGCGDSSIRVIDSSSFTILFSLQGHSGSVDHLTIVNKVLVSAGTDRTLRLWYLPDRKLVHILRGHTDDIECMCSHGNHVVTGSWDKSVMLWNIEHGEHVATFQGHTEVVNCCLFDGVRIISGSGDGDIKIWTISPPDCKYTLSGHEAEVYCLTSNKTVIASGSSDSTVRVWNYAGKCLHVLHGHLGVVRCLYMNEERLVSGGDQKKIIVWDYKTGQKLNDVHRQPSLLHLMWVNETKLITASPERPGLHKKSIEAQETLKDKDSTTDSELIEVIEDNPNAHAGSKDLRSESIAVLLSKALEHSARI